MTLTKERWVAIRSAATPGAVFPGDPLIVDLLTEYEILEVEHRRVLDGLCPPHRCQPVASILRGALDEGRDWWIGRLLEPVPDWPKETHCLHIKTPVKDIVLLIWEGDVEWFSVLFHAAYTRGHPINQEWLDRVADGAIKAARARFHTQFRHHWSGWPGATCLHCGTDDPMEYAIGSLLYDPYLKVWATPEAEREFLANNECHVGYSPQCGQCDPNRPSLKLDPLPELEGS